MYNLKMLHRETFFLRAELLIKGKYGHHKVIKEKEGRGNQESGATDRTARAGKVGIPVKIPPGAGKAGRNGWLLTDVSSHLPREGSL